MRQEHEAAEEIKLLPVQQETDARAPARQIAKAIAEIVAWSRPDYDPENQLYPWFPQKPPG
jgi:hypothetical protein